MAHVREKPPLRLHWDLKTPNGRHYRWGEDEPEAQNIPKGTRFSTTMPGGFETADVRLARKPGVDYSDLERLSTLCAYGAGAECAGEFRLERAPRASGNEMAVSPSAVGWQAHLEDDKAREIYDDRDLSRWGPGTSRRQASLLASVFKPNSFETLADPEDVRPGLKAQFDRLAQSAGPVDIDLRESWYDGQNIPIGSLAYSFDMIVGMGDTNWSNQAKLSTDDLHSSTDNGTDHDFTDAANQTLTATTATRTWATFQTSYNVAVAAQDGKWSSRWYDIAVFGAHGLTKRGTAPNQGFYGSDIVGHAVGRWAPLLTTDIDQSSYVITHAAFLEPTTAGEIVKQATRFGLQDWAVWENKTFVWHRRGARGRSWRARIAPSQLQETGPQIDRLWESVVVQYQDVDGSTRTVGPVGSGANTESADLHDDDPENPANKLGIVRRAHLQMGIAGLPGDAIEAGRRFLEEQKLLDTSGQASLVGHVQDDRGVLHAAWKVRAGDTITFVDANDSSPRRIVKTDYDHDTRTCRIDLDSPPEGLQVALERIGAELVGLGL